MPKHFIVKPLDIVKTDRFINQIIPAEGVISSIEFHDDMVFIKLKDPTGVLDVTLLQSKVKKYGPMLKKIKNYETTRIQVEGLLQLFPKGVKSERGYEMILNTMKIINKPSILNAAINTESFDFNNKKK
ncbi:hypothetical protein HANVADRAFT_52000 [Hanseniaspora valbyensis NRRL Y-1626]|uniref:Uncharacterized protein n=1 Tax=Hanseniaspora valbyensis NRRL Y-1626 TaxID=766949 RepID=A0A1B7TGQ0_9ASCO|nr:hypothetical protein HANVADRAFT_52000 [Hanseniaspora valbyensis NRRL Y-1626]